MKLVKPLLFISVVSVSILGPFFFPGYLESEDGVWAIVRQAEMHREIKDLQLPPRWAGYLNHGYGYPLFLFTYPLPYLIGELFLVFQLGVIATVKLSFILATFFSLFAIYLFISRLWGTNAAYLATILFAYAPYRYTNLYLRGSMGEVWAFAFYPLLLLGFYELIKDPSRLKFLACTVFTALFLLTHNASIILFLPFLVAWIAINIWIYGPKPKNVGIVILTLCFGFGLAAWFWLPAIVEKKYINLSLFPLTYKPDHFLTLGQLILGQIHANTGLPLSIGIIHLVIALVAAVFAIHQIKYRLFGVVLLVAGFLGLFMTHRYSELLWRMPLLSEIDFPWRMLGIATLFLSILGGFVARGKYGNAATIVFTMLFLFLQLPQLSEVKRADATDEYFETNDATTTSADELMPIWVQTKPAQRPISLIRSAGNGVQVRSYTGNRMQIDVNTKVTREIIVNTLYFPGWRVTSEGKEILLQPTSGTGLISFVAQPGLHTYTLNFGKTPVRQIADSLSIISILSLVPVWIRLKKFFRS